MATPMATRLAAALLLATAATVPASAQQAETTPPLDLIQDDPSFSETVSNVLFGSVGWVWGLLTTGVTKVAPPSPTSLTQSISEDDRSELFKLLGVAGYKLKKIESQVGLIPGVAFDFAMVRQLSEADIDFLEAELEASRLTSPGLYTEIQRTIVGTVLSINSGDSYQVSEMTVQILPLPKVEFAVTPVVAALGEESSILMRAIQRLDRNMRGIGRPQPAVVPAMATIPGAATTMPVAVKTASVATSIRVEDSAPASRRYLGLGAADWVFGGAILFIVLGLLTELIRRTTGLGSRAIPALANSCFAVSGIMWLGLGYAVESWLVMIGGGLVLGFAIALLLQRFAMAKPDDAPPVPDEGTAAAGS